MTPDVPRLRALLGGEGLIGLRRRLRQRFERGAQDGDFTLGQLQPIERAALENLLGAPLRAARSMRLSVGALDAVLVRAGLAGSLRDALEMLDGPIVNRAAETSVYQRGWELTVASAPSALRALVSTSAGVGLLKRWSGDEPARGQALLVSAARVIAELPAHGVQRSRLAAQITGDAHALDTGRPLASLVLRVLRRDDDEKPRDTWAAHGVLVNELAKPVLALNLPVLNGSSMSELVAAARVNGEPVHLNLRALLRSGGRWSAAGVDVYVCENPALIATAADRLGPTCPPLVCTDGMPAAAQQALLRQLGAQGAALHYHGDFDWPGIRIGNVVIGSFGAEPWRFGSADYQASQGRLLDGDPVAAVWDAGLAERMAAAGVAVEEETVQETLLNDLLDTAHRTTARTSSTRA